MSDFSLETYKFNPVKITKKDFIKLRLKQADDMENFLKLKGLYNEYYDKYIAPEFVLSISFDDLRSSFDATIKK